MRPTCIVTVMLALLFFCGVVFAAEATKPAQTPPKAAKPAAKPADDKSGAAEKPAADKKADEKKADDKSAKTDEKTGEKKEDELTPLETQLTVLQQALEKASADARNRIPANAQGLLPYLKNKEKDFINPETQQNILSNTDMWGKFESRITKPEEFVTFYADAPTPDKGRAVMFADGTIKYLSEEQFKKAMEASKIKRMTADDATDARETRRPERYR